MGSDLYVSVTTGSFPLFRAGSCALERGIVVDAFEGDTHRVTAADWPRSLLAPCPWDEEAYWVRALPGAEFCTIVREKRWQKLQNGDFADKECSPDLRAIAALVESLLKDGVNNVRVWCWHSQ